MIICALKQTAIGWGKEAGKMQSVRVHKIKAEAGWSKLSNEDKLKLSIQAIDGR